MRNTCEHACISLFILVALGLAIQAQADTIHACMSQIDGQLRVASEAEQCNAEENMLAWRADHGRAAMVERPQAYSGLPKNQRTPTSSDMNLYLE